MKHGLWAALLGAGLLICAGTQVPAQQMYKTTAVRDGGSIRGTVRLTGKAPAQEPIVMTKDADFCGRTHAPSRLLVSSNGGVKNAVILLEGITEGKKSTSRKHVVLDQRSCEFIPHVVVLKGGEPLEIVNHDPVLHNVHAYDADGMKTLFNIAQPVKGQRTVVPAAQFKNAETVLTTCDAGHPWMGAYVVRSPHPYVAVTDMNGRFSIDDIPPGSYTVKMWHEGVAVTQTAKEGSTATKYTYEDPYVQTTQVTIAPHGVATANFDLTLR